MYRHSSELQFAICVNNKDYPASLECRKIYQVIPDGEAAHHRQICVVDESGEDYLYSAESFGLIDLPESTEKLVLETT